MTPVAHHPAACKHRIRASLVAALCACATLAATLVPPSALAGSGDAQATDGRVSPFYAWAKPLDGAAGQILREEPLEAAVQLSAAGQQYRILYSSTDGVSGHGLVAVSGAVFLPPGQPPRGGWPLLAWAHGTVGIADACAPSWNVRSYRDARYLNAWLKQGFAVVATDYQGLGTPGPHPYMDARVEAYSVLDSIRAAQAKFPELSRKVILIGQSQGAGAAFASAAFAPVYATELDILGTISTGTPYLAPKAMAAASSHDPHEVRPQFAYTAFLALAAQAQAQPPAGLSSVFTERAMPLVEEARGACIAQMEADVVSAGISDANALQGNLMVFIGSYAKTFMYPTLKLAQPLFMGIGAQDQDATTASQLMLAHDACAAGSTVEAHLYKGLDHNATVNASLKDSIPFARRLLAGKQIAPVCAPVAQ